MANNNRQLSNLKIAHSNANGLSEKWTDLKNFLGQHNIDLMAINEVRFSEKHKFFLSNVKTNRLTRPGKNSGGGNLILVNNKIKQSTVSHSFNFKTTEAIGVRLENNTTIYSVYARPVINNLVNKIDTTELDQLMCSSNKVILIGDFNAKHPSWNCKVSNSSGRTILNYTNTKHYVVLAPDRHTLYLTNSGQPITVDFAITKNINA